MDLSMPEDLKVSQIGSSPLPPPFKGLHSPGVRKHCQIIFACYFQKSSVGFWFFLFQYLQVLCTLILVPDCEVAQHTDKMDGGMKMHRLTNTV